MNCEERKELAFIVQNLKDIAAKNFPTVSVNELAGYILREATIIYLSEKRDKASRD